MSISTSKSKTQLAYARSGKAVNKPKGKTSTPNESNDATKSRHPSRNSTGNIYESILGQIEPTQQDYIKNLIVKQERQSLKNQKQSALKQSKKIVNPPKQQKKLGNNASNKKQQQSVKKLHDRTRSQAQLILVKQSPRVEIQSQRQLKKQSQKVVKTQVSKPSPKQQQAITEESAVMQNNSEVMIESQLKIANNSNSNTKLINPNGNTIKNDQSNQRGYRLSAPELNEKPTANPIIEALTNSGSSFAKKLETFQLQYPLEQRQQRSTHKKTASKLAPTQYYSCQVSPKNQKNLYTKQVVITTKPYPSNMPKRGESISPVSNIQQQKKGQNINASNQKDGNFLSCLDEYLQALTVSQFDQSEENHPYNPNCKNSTNNRMSQMKIKRNSKIKELQPTKFNNPFTLGPEEQQEETIVLQNGICWKPTNLSLSQQQKIMAFSQQQKLIKSLQKQRQTVFELKNVIEDLQKQLQKYKKKETKLKQNQYHMIELLKSIDQQLNEQKRQRKKLQNIVGEFENKIRGISKNKDKKRRQTIEDEQHPQRKTIYGVSSNGNSINYQRQHLNQFHPSCYQQQQNYLRQTPKNHSKKPSMGNNYSRFSSVIQPSYNYPQNQQSWAYPTEEYNQKKYKQKNNSNSKNHNRTQKISKIISSFELENHQQQDDDNVGYAMRMANNGGKSRNSIKNNAWGYNAVPQSCKNSYLNSSLPANFSKQSKSRPMTPKLIDELFNQSKKNSRYQQMAHNLQQSDSDGQSQNSNEQDFQNIDQTNSKFIVKRQVTEDEEGEYCERTEQSEDQGYHQMIVRMR